MSVVNPLEKSFTRDEAFMSVYNAPIYKILIVESSNEYFKDIIIVNNRDIIIWMLSIEMKFLSHILNIHFVEFRHEDNIKNGDSNISNFITIYLYEYVKSKLKNPNVINNWRIPLKEKNNADPERTSLRYSLSSCLDK